MAKQHITWYNDWFSKQNICVETKKSSVAKGAVVLLLAGLFCKFLGAFYRIPLSNILGAEGIGIYQLIFPIYSIFLILVSGGITTTLAKIVAELRAKNEENKIFVFLKIAFIFTLVLSFIIALCFVLFAQNIAAFQGNFNAKLGYIAISVAIVFSSLITVYRGYFQGYEKMTPTAFSQMIEQVFKLVLGLLLAKVFLKYGESFGVFGALVGVSVSEMFCLIYLFFLFHKEKKVKLKKTEVSKQEIKMFFKNLLPISLNSLLIPLISAIDSLLVINLLTQSGSSQIEATKMFGIYSGMVNSVVNFPTIFAVAVSVAILPTLAFEFKQTKDLSKISTSYKTIFFVVMPCFFVFLFFAPNIIEILFSNSLSNYNFLLAKNLLVISSANIIFLSYLQFSTSVLQAINKSYVCLLNLLLAAILKVGLTIYLTSSSLGILGACMASVLCYLLACFLNLNYLTELNIKQDKSGYLKIAAISLTVSVLMFYVNKVFVKFLNNNVSFVITGIFGILLYLFACLKLKVFSSDELNKFMFFKKAKINKNKIG